MLGSATNSNPLTRGTVADRDEPLRATLISLWGVFGTDVVSQTTANTVCQQHASHAHGKEQYSRRTYDIPRRVTVWRTTHRKLLVSVTDSELLHNR